MTFPPSQPIFDGPFPWPPSEEPIRQALQEAFASGDWGRYEGRFSLSLVELLARHHQVAHVQLCSSGTIAVELALRGGKIGPGDEVLLAGYDFPGNFRAIEAVGAVPVLIDLQVDSWAIDTNLIAAAVTTQTKGIIVSHLHGTLVDMPAVMEIALKRGLYVVEDACQVPGAVVAGKAAGSWGDAGVLSFGGSKLVTAGRGGAVLTSRDDVKQRMTIFTDRGNNAFPLSELQAAVILPQWKSLSQTNQVRSARVKSLASTNDWPPCLHWPAAVYEGAESRPAYYKVGWFFDHPWQARDAWLADANRLNLPVDSGFRGFTRRGASRCRLGSPLPNAERAALCTVLLHHPILLQEEEILERLTDGLRSISAV